MKTYTRLAFLFAIIIFMALPSAHAEGLKPFILASQKPGNIEAVVKQTKKTLQNGGFQIAGDYSPYPEAFIIVITNQEMRQTASQSKHGGFGAMQRVAVTKVGDDVQVSYTNPEYMFHVYRMEGNYKNISRNLKKLLGAEKQFGAEEYDPEDLSAYSGW